jgi:hypothetical protein
MSPGSNIEAENTIDIAASATVRSDDQYEQLHQRPPVVRFQSDMIAQLGGPSKFISADTRWYGTTRPRGVFARATGNAPRLSKEKRTAAWTLLWNHPAAADWPGASAMDGSDEAVTSGGAFGRQAAGWLRRSATPRTVKAFELARPGRRSTAAQMKLSTTITNTSRRANGIVRPAAVQADTSTASAPGHDNPPPTAAAWIASNKFDRLQRDGCHRV